MKTLALLLSLAALQQGSFTKDDILKLAKAGIGEEGVHPLEIKLVDEDGLALIKNVRARGPSRQIPIVALVEHGDQPAPPAAAPAAAAPGKPRNPFAAYNPQGSAAPAGRGPALGAAKDKVSLRVAFFQAGADECLSLNWDTAECVARLKAVLRRTQMPELWDGRGIVRGRGFVADLSRRRVEVEGREVSLTVTEWKLLSFLVRNQGRVVSSQMLADRVWGVDHLSDAAIRAGVRRLRLKLGDDPQKPRIIRSHRGMGYSLALPR